MLFEVCAWPKNPAHISHQCPWAATKSMAPAVSKPSTAKRRRAISPSQLPRRLHQFPIAGEEGR